jgi:sirohydrochlorin cobaltochelatase
MVRQRLPDVAVELAFLEFMPPDLPTLVLQLAQQGYTEATVVPLFLGHSGHVLRDIPPMLERLQQQTPVISLRLAKTVGDNAEVLEAMAAYCVTTL